ncbi:MAG: response regulator transcription factor [Xanthomonadales bacterium]|nr:response regulator transcription factor [Xanthomonadales bacterium]
MPRLLVVDDNALSLHFFGEALAALGIECATAASAGEAIERAAISTYDLLLIDAHLPDMHGAELLQRIRNGDGASRWVTALATTAATGADAALLAAGFVDVLPKPIGIEVLRARLHAHLSGASGRDVRPCLDMQRAQAALGDARFIAPLRELLSRELEGVPREFAALAARDDVVGMRDRLHRLAASAGLCGAVALGTAIGELQSELAAGTTSGCRALPEFLDACAQTRDAIARISDSLPPASTT